jgi:hypothetical protein
VPEPIDPPRLEDEPFSPGQHALQAAGTRAGAGMARGLFALLNSRIARALALFAVVVTLAFAHYGQWLSALQMLAFVALWAGLREWARKARAYTLHGVRGP